MEAEIKHNDPNIDIDLYMNTDSRIENIDDIDETDNKSINIDIINIAR